MGPPKLLGHLDVTISTPPWPIQAPLSPPHSNQHFLLDVFLEPPTAFQAPGSSMHGFAGHFAVMSISHSLTCSRLSLAKPDQGLHTAHSQLQHRLWHTGGTQ